MAFFITSILSLVQQSDRQKTPQLNSWLRILIDCLLIINAITIGLIAAQYNGFVKRKLISAALTLSLMYLCELGVGVVFEGSMFGSASLNLKALVVSKLLNFFIVLIISRVWKGKNSPSVSTDWSAIALIPISTAVLEIAVISSVQSAAIIVLSVVIVLFLNVVVFYLFDKLAENYARKIALARAEQKKRYTTINALP